MNSCRTLQWGYFMSNCTSRSPKRYRNPNHIHLSGFLKKILKIVCLFPKFPHRHTQILPIATGLFSFWSQFWSNSCFFCSLMERVHALSYSPTNNIRKWDLCLNLRLVWGLFCVSCLFLRSCLVQWSCLTESHQICWCKIEELESYQEQNAIKNFFWLECFSPLPVVF